MKLMFISYCVELRGDGEQLVTTFHIMASHIPTWGRGAYIQKELRASIIPAEHTLSFKNVNNATTQCTAF